MLKPKQTGELILDFLLLLFAIACIFFSKTGSDALGMQNEHLTPNTYSNILSIVLIAAVLVHVVSLVRRSGTSRQEDTVQEALPIPLKRKESLTVGFTMVIAILYILGIRYIGFYVTTTACLFVLNMTFEEWVRQRLWKAAAFSLGVCLIFLIVFQYLKIFLPKAIFF